MRRIGLAVVLAVGLFLAPLATEAQQAGKVPRIGVFGSPEFAARPFWGAFRQGLRDLGYVEGRSIAIAWHPRKSGQTTAAWVAEVIDSGVDILVVDSSTIATAAKQATATIPIVMISADPVAAGLVSSLARPGGNVTGPSTLGTGVVGTQVQLLKEAIPRISRLAILWDPDNPTHAPTTREAETAALTLAMRPQLFPVHAGKDLERTFSAMGKAGAEALLVLADSQCFTRIEPEYWISRHEDGCRSCTPDGKTSRPAA